MFHANCAIKLECVSPKELSCCVWRADPCLPCLISVMADFCVEYQYQQQQLIARAGGTVRHGRHSANHHPLLHIGRAGGRVGPILYGLRPLWSHFKWTKDIQYIQGLQIGKLLTLNRLAEIIFISFILIQLNGWDSITTYSVRRPVIIIIKSNSIFFISEFLNVLFNPFHRKK